MNKNVLSVVLIVVALGVGFLVGRFTPVANTVISGTQNPTGEDAEQGTKADATEGSVSVKASNLTDGQKKLLTALGIDADTITVTPEMIACAETSLGDARVVEITNGATPSFTEGLKLAACYQ